MRLALLLLLVTPASSLAQVVTGPGTYCITGSSTGTDYSWWVDLDADGAGLTSEPHILSQNAVPATASATALASAFADQINLCSRSGICDVGGTDLCVSGANLGAACTQDLDCDGPVTCTGTCQGGPLDGSPCAVLDDCHCVTASASGNCFTISTSFTYSLRVDAASASPPTCVVAASPGCSYNPTIALAGPAPLLPTWGRIGLLVLVAAALTPVARARFRVRTDSRPSA